jgi:hypothetical protein
MQTLYLIESCARKEYVCPSCNKIIPRGVIYFRHDPHPFARQYRGHITSHWCRDCILSSHPIAKDKITGRIRIPVINVVGSSQSNGGNQKPISLDLMPLKIEVIGISDILIKQILDDPSWVYQITPEDFEELICDRLYNMGLEPKRVGQTNRKDGGIDIIFWPRINCTFPFLGAAQVKHHRRAEKVEGPSTVRDFAGAIAGHPFNVGMVVTNTTFSPDAEWFARERAKLIRLRDFEDIRRWLINNFTDELEWRHIPSAIELCPGITVNLR